MPSQRFDFERLANAAGYFRMNLGRVRSKADFDSCERAGLFSQEILLTLDPETRAVPNRRELKSYASEIAPGVFQPNSTIDWLDIFGGSWSITASVSDNVWLDQFLKSYSNPVVVTYTTIENSSFSELLAVIKIRPEAILVSLNESRGVTVIGRGAAYEGIVRAAALRKATIDQAKRTAFTIDDYSASALKSAEKFARSLARVVLGEPAKPPRTEVVLSPRSARQSKRMSIVSENPIVTELGSLFSNVSSDSQVTTTNRVSFEQVAVAAGYFSMRWKSPFSMMYFEGCLQTGLFGRDLVLTLDSETRAAPVKKEVATNSVEIVKGVYRPNSSIDWNRIFRGSWTITAIEQSDHWLGEFLENFTLPIVPTYSTLRYPPFPELLPVMQLHKSHILASLCTSRSLTVVGRGVSFERLVQKVGGHMSKKTPVELQALAINDYSAIALECAGKFSRQLSNSLSLPILGLPQAEGSAAKLSLPHSKNNAKPLFRTNHGFPARPIDLRTIRQRYGDHPVLAEVALHTGAEWLIDEKNVAHLRFFTSPEIVDETQELMDMREDMDANCPEIDNETTLAIAQFHESGDRICVLLSGPKAGAVAMLSLDSDDAILFESFKEFIASLDADAVALLRKFGVADVAVAGEMVKPYDV